MRMTTMHGASAPSLAALALAGLLAGCGSGGEAIGEYEQLVIGPDGGHAEAQNVSLVVPPGAFTQDHVCAILEQPDPLPIEQQQDGSTIEYHDNIMCIGPLDLDLLVPGYLRMCYPLTFPKGFGEEDLVLLEWDEALGVMRVSEDAVQNLATHCFEDFSYDTLGHVAIGRRTAPPDPAELDFTFYAEPPVAAAGLPTTTGIVLVDLDDILPTAVVPGTAGAADYLGNGPGSRVLYRTFTPQTESSTLRTFDVPPLADREVLAADTFAPSSPLFGWLGFGDTVYYDERDPVILLGAVPLPNAFGTVPGDGGVPDPIYPYAGGLSLEDVRISPDGTMALLRFLDFGQQTFEPRVHVIDVLGNVLVADLPCDLDSNDPTPRFLPDSSGITFLANDGVTVKRVDPDGANESDFYVLPSPGFLVDFAVAPPFPPLPQRCAYVRRDFGEVAAAGLPAGGPDYFETDRLAGGDVQSTSLGGPFEVVDLVPLFSDNWASGFVGLQLQTSRSIDVIGPQGLSEALPSFFGLSLFFNLEQATLHRAIPAPLAWIDFSRQTQPSAYTGSALVAIPLVDTEVFPEYPTPGIYHLDAFLQKPTLVTPPGFTMAGPPRWLQSWRHSPGFSPFEGVR